MLNWSDWFLVLLLVLLGSVAGTYLAWQPAVKSAKAAVSETAQQAQQTLKVAEESIQRAGENLAALEITVPEPQVMINFQWWHVFAVTLGMVLGTALVRLYDRSALRKMFERSLARMRRRKASRSKSWRRKASI